MTGNIYQVPPAGLLNADEVPVVCGTCLCRVHHHLRMIASRKKSDGPGAHEGGGLKQRLGHDERNRDCPVLGTGKGCCSRNDRGLEDPGRRRSRRHDLLRDVNRRSKR